MDFRLMKPLIGLPEFLTSPSSGFHGRLTKLVNCTNQVIGDSLATRQIQDTSQVAGYDVKGVNNENEN
jgi:hypothetical protein